jgi:hypothetical protein
MDLATRSGTAAAPSKGKPRPAEKSACCPPKEQSNCCEPAEKTECCGTSTAAGACGCR